MAILGSIASLLAVSIAVPLDTLIKRTNVNRKVAEMEARGCFKHTNYDYENLVKDVVIEDWNSGSRELYPKILIPFFEKNAGALFGYQDALTKQKVCDAGYKPMGVPDVVFTGPYWHPFMFYNKDYAAVEREWMHRNEPDELARLDQMRREKEETTRVIEEAVQKKENNSAVWSLVGVIIVICVFMGIAMAIDSGIIGAAIFFGGIWLAKKIFIG
jgi:hypothetical protein